MNKLHLFKFEAYILHIGILHIKPTNNNGYANLYCTIQGPNIILQLLIIVNYDTIFELYAI